MGSSLAGWEEVIFGLRRASIVVAELGVPLFERVAKDEVRLTPAGERLYAFCAPFFEEVDAVADAIRSERLGGPEAVGVALEQPDSDQ
ncbi:MAG: hypothetical protein AMXMBFR56_35590 [Polyangiaceae bacterium]